MHSIAAPECLTEVLATIFMDYTIIKAISSSATVGVLQGEKNHQAVSESAIPYLMKGEVDYREVDTSLGNMGIVLSTLKDWYNSYTEQVKEPVIKLVDPIFHYHKIKTYGMDLRNTELPLENRAMAALYIGLLAYTGGGGAATFASQYLKDMIDILIMPDTSTKVRISVLKGLCSVCYINPLNQNEAKAYHLTEIILAYLEEDEDSAEADSDLVLVKFWVCYLMTVVCCNNMPYVKLFHEVGGQTLERRLEYLSNMEWSGWPQNYATLMCMLMGYPGMELYK